MINRRCAMSILAAVATTGRATAASAEGGVSDSQILLGRTIPTTGALAHLAREYIVGADLCFDWINDQGGVHGRKVRVVTLDDGYDPSRSLENVKLLIESHGVFALFGLFGTGSAITCVPKIEVARVPLIAPASGADAIRSVASRFTFPVRTAYSEELRRIVEHLITVGIGEIGVVHQDDGFGIEGRKAAIRAIEERGLRPASVEAIEMPSANGARAAQVLAKTPPKAILLIAAAKGAISFLRAFPVPRIATAVYVLSVVSSKQLIADLGEHVRDVVVSQVVPSPWNSNAPVVRLYRELLAAAKAGEPSYSSLESFIAARACVEALRRTGPGLTRERLVFQMSSMTSADLGGFQVNFNDGIRQGSRYVELTMIGSDGRFLR